LKATTDDDNVSHRHRKA